MTAILDSTSVRTAPDRVRFLELEITHQCELRCPSHCYAQAGPTKGHGSMTAEDWQRVIYDAAACGVTKVQFIGGEPTRHPAFAQLVRYAVSCGLQVQVYSNLYRVKAEHWELYEHPRVTLATSYYSSDPAEHDQVTGRRGSHQRTRAAIIEAHDRGIPVQVGIVEMLPGQRVEEARAELEALGITAINTDRARAVGNAAADTTRTPELSELCGNCAKGRAAVMPNGMVTPCVLGRFLPAGTVKASGGLASVLKSRRWAEVAALIPARANACPPDDSGDCDPANTNACDPAYG